MFSFFFFTIALISLKIKKKNFKAIHRELTKSELLQTFGVHKVEHVPEYHLIDTFREKNTDGNVKAIRFTAWNSTYV